MDESLEEEKISDNNVNISVGHFATLAISFVAFGSLMYWTWNFFGHVDRLQRLVLSFSSGFVKLFSSGCLE